MPFQNVRGIDIHYEDEGEGPPLVVAHGLFDSIENGRVHGLNPAHVAAHGLRVVSYDARGHGLSGFSSARADYRWVALAEDLRALVDAIGLERFSIYGTSMGAGVALTFALAHPERIERLVLKSPPPFEPDLAISRRRLGALALAYELLGAPLTARLAGTLSRSAREPALLSLLAEQRPRAIGPAIRGLLFGKPQLPAHRLSEVGAPTLVLAHPDDVQHPLRSAELLSQTMPRATLRMTPGADYWRTHRDELTRLIANFVTMEGGMVAPRI